MNKNKRKQLAQAKLMEINPEMGMSWQEPVAFAMQSNCSYPACVWGGSKEWGLRRTRTRRRAEPDSQHIAISQIKQKAAAEKNTQRRGDGAKGARPKGQCTGRGWHRIQDSGSRTQDAGHNSANMHCTCSESYAEQENPEFGGLKLFS